MSLGRKRSSKVRSRASRATRPIPSWTKGEATKSHKRHIFSFLCLLCLFVTIRLNHGAALDDSVFRHDHNPISNVEPRPVEILDPFFIQDPHVVSNVGILVDDGFS